MEVVVIKNSDDGQYKKGSHLGILRNSELYNKLTEAGIITDYVPKSASMVSNLVNKLNPKNKVKQDKIKDNGSD